VTDAQNPKDPKPSDRVTLAIEKLAETLTSDVEKGLGLSRSGWTNPTILGLDPAYIRNLIEVGVLAENENGSVRLNPGAKSMIKKMIGRYEVLHNQVNYGFDNADALRLDSERIAKASHTLSRVSDSLQHDEGHWSDVVCVGWWRMLESSGMPAPLDAIIGAGFSPMDWTLKATWASFQLALTVASRVGTAPSFEESAAYLSDLLGSENSKIAEPPTVEPGDLIKIQETLRWNDILHSIPADSQKALGLAWFCYFLWELDDCLPFSEANSDALFSQLLVVICELTKTTASDIASSRSILVEKGLIWAEEIICLPEVT